MSLSDWDKQRFSCTESYTLYNHFQNIHALIFHIIVTFVRYRASIAWAPALFSLLELGVNIK